jgi:hypothetical protein
MEQENHKSIIKKILTDRKFIFTFLIVIFILLSVYYASNYQKHLENPNTGVILKNYPRGDIVAVSGEITAVNNNSFLLLDQYHGIKVNYTVFSSEKVKLGDQAEVLGVLGNFNQITAQKILVVTNFDYLFMIVRSAIVVLIFVFFFRRYWRYDFKKLEFRRLK